jgi:hypothetical protein
VTELFGQVFAFVLMAFLLGVLVGWLFWRFRRVSVADDDWGAVTRDLAALQLQLNALQRERDAAAAHAAWAAEEVGRLQGQLTSAWHDRDVLRLELGRAAGALAETRALLDRTTAQARYLQRRVTELSILHARQPLRAAPAPPGLGRDAGSPLGLPVGRGNGSDTTR